MVTPVCLPIFSEPPCRRCSNIVVVDAIVNWLLRSFRLRNILPSALGQHVAPSLLRFMMTHMYQSSQFPLLSLS